MSFAAIEWDGLNSSQGRVGWPWKRVPVNTEDTVDAFEWFALDAVLVEALKLALRLVFITSYQSL